MKLKLGENLGERGRQVLSAAGHDACTVAVQKLKGATDAELLRRCAAEQRALVTLDLDFANPLIYPPDRHAGVGVLRLPRKPTRAHLDHVIATLAEALRRQSLEGELWIVEARRIRVHLRES
ncbi:MAG: hypothetical protein CK538_06550 [Opitutia bacterium]|nr:hypothetical protein [Opitutaceae bacterium]PHX85468.1 MAG: hypothetical protein CK538_06550 [Opitutae bacterium]